LSPLYSVVSEIKPLQNFLFSISYVFLAAKKSHKKLSAAVSLYQRAFFDFVATPVYSVLLDFFATFEAFLLPSEIPLFFCRFAVANILAR